MAADMVQSSGAMNLHDLDVRGIWLISREKAPDHSKD